MLDKQYSPYVVPIILKELLEQFPIWLSKCFLFKGQDFTINYVRKK